MKTKQNLFVTMCFLLMFALGCATTTQLETGINLSETYVSLHNQYLNVYDSVDEDTQEYMKEKIAPKMNRVKKEIIEYNDIAISGENATEQKEMIIDKLRDLSKEIAGVGE